MASWGKWRHRIPGCAADLLDESDRIDIRKI